MICEAYAEQRGFYTAQAAQPDAYRGKYIYIYIIKYFIIYLMIILLFNNYL